MKKLLALLAAIGAVVFFWRKKNRTTTHPAGTRPRTPHPRGVTPPRTRRKMPPTRPRMRRKTPPTPWATRRIPQPTPWTTPRRRRPPLRPGHHEREHGLAANPPGGSPPSRIGWRLRSGPRGGHTAATRSALFVCFDQGGPGNGSAGDRGFAAAACGDEVAVVTGEAPAGYAPGRLALRQGELLERALHGLSASPTCCSSTRQAGTTRGAAGSRCTWEQCSGYRAWV